MGILEEFKPEIHRLLKDDPKLEVVPSVVELR
jgi:hypothetical protein